MNEVSEFFDAVFLLQQAKPSAQEIIFAILLSFALTLINAAVYCRTYKGTQYSQDYVHTLVILGVVVTVIIMVVGGNAAMAFGLFAAFSIIRFRTTLPHARDIGFIFFAMASGLAVGARQYVLAILTTILIGALIYAFSRYDLFAPRRASHFLRVRVTTDIDYDQAFTECFARCAERIHLVSIASIQAGMMTELCYELRLKPDVAPGEFVSAIQHINGNNRVLLTTATPGFTNEAR